MREMAVVGFVTMASPRPVFHPELGRFFVDLRERQTSWNQNAAGRMAEERALPGLSRKVLPRLEHGKIKNLEPETLRSLAALYNVSYEWLVHHWVRIRYSVDVKAQPIAPPPFRPGEKEMLAALRKLTDEGRHEVLDVIRGKLKRASRSARDRPPRASGF
jgi:hypothetical protein